MRILAVQSNMHPVRGGGGAERTLQLSRALARAGCSVTVLCVDLGGIEVVRSRLAPVPLETVPCLMRRFALPAPVLGVLTRLVRSVDVLHVQGHWGPLNALVTQRARALDVPYVVSPAGALRIFGRSRLAKAAYNRLAGNRMVREASGWIAVTPAELPHFAAYGVPSERVRVIPNAVSRTEYSHRDDAGFRSRFELGDAPLLLFMGRLSAIKGPDLLIEAFARAHQRIPHTLVMAGADDGTAGGLADQVARYGLGDRIRFVGHLSGPWKSAAYHAAELLVIPSRHEAMSLVVLEGGVAGTPFLATDQCGLEELARAGGGSTVAPTAEGLAAGLETALTDRSALAERGRKLQRIALRDATWEVAADSLLAYFDEIGLTPP